MVYFKKINDWIQFSTLKYLLFEIIREHFKLAHIEKRDFIITIFTS